MPFTLKELFIKRNVILIYISIIIILISFILNSISDEKNSLKTLFSVILYISMFIGYLVFLDIKSIKNTISTKQYIFKLMIWMMTYLIISMGILYLHFEILNIVDNAILRLFLMFLNYFILFCFYYQSFKRRKSFKF